MSGEAHFRQYDLGTLAALESHIERLNRRGKKIRYRLSPLEDQQSFWVFEQVFSDEESACAIVRLEKDRIVAIGDDAFQFVTKALAKA